jgi:predicted nucleotidyltransferase component of viral defense system
MLHREILNSKQVELLPLISAFKREYYLVGGTAIALHFGHRRSVDFDLFKFSQINHNRNIDKLIKSKFDYKITRRVYEQMNVEINSVKLTFFQYPFDIKPTIGFDKIIKMPSLLDLAAMKAYALGRRAKWKDYVDLYFISEKYSLKEISDRAEVLFADLFSEKLFRSQLSYFDDIDYSEEVEFLIEKPPKIEFIKQTLIEKSINF